MRGGEVSWARLGEELSGAVRAGAGSGGTMASRLDSAGLQILAHPARPMTSHMKPTPRTVQTRVRRLGWWAWASGRMSAVAR